MTNESYSRVKQLWEDTQNYKLIFAHRDDESV